MYKNEWVIYLFGGVIAALILLMSAFFLVKALRRAKELGISRAKIVKTVTSSAVFSIVPSVPIIIGIGIMMPWLGLAIPWIRLTVVGALQYELMAMQQATEAAGVTSYGAMTDTVIATAFTIMTVSILSGLIFNAVAYKKYQNKLSDLREKNPKLLNTVTGALLGGILSGLASYIIAGGIFNVKNTGGDNVAVSGAVTLITLAASAAIMLLCGILIKKLKWKWLESYALPITIVGALFTAYAVIPLF